MKFITTLLSLFVATMITISCNSQDHLGDGLFAKINTTKGNIIVKLEFQKAPLTVANFVGLAEGKIENKAKPLGEPYYDGIVFHRVVNNFMIQTGDPTGTGRGGPGYEFQDEFHPDLKHDRAGTLSMANRGKDTNGSQIFITHTATPQLNSKHSVFGYVVEGQSTVDLIEKGDEIKSIEIIRNGKAAKSFDAAATFSRLKI